MESLATDLMMRRRGDNSRLRPNNRKGGGGSSALVRNFGLLLGSIALGALIFRPAVAQEFVDERREYNVKAVSLYAFGRYVTWPDTAFPDPKAPFVIGVFGGNPFGDSLERIAAKKTLNNRAIVVRSITTVEEVPACHMVFVTRSVAAEDLDRVFALVAGKPVLLVGETPGFTQRGGIINFYQSGTNVRFELNPEKGEESKLSLNAKLLSLGTKASTRQ